MRKLLIILCLIFLIANVASSSIGSTQENSKANDATSATSTLVEEPEQAFRFEPTVTFQSFNSEINKKQNGTIEFFLKNPSLNNVTLEVDLNIGIPSDISYIYSEDGSLSRGVGAANKHFSVSPGTSKIVTLNFTGEKTGTLFVHSDVKYWPGKNKNDLSTMSQDSVVKVDSSDNTQITPEHIHNAPGLGVTSIIFILIIVLIFRRK
jgi:hypothetical protein